MMVDNILKLRHLLVKLYTLHRGASFHSNLRNSHNDNHYADIEDLNGRWHLDGEDTAYPGGVWVLECQTLSQNFIFRTSEQSYTMDIDIIYSIEHGQKSKDVCQNCSGSRYHRVTATLNSIIKNKPTFQNIKNYQNRFTERGERCL